VIAVAAGLKKAIGHPFEALDDWIAAALALGTALYVACDTGFRATFGLAGSRARAAAVVLSAATLPIGIAIGGAAQVAALAMILGLALLASRQPPAATTS
jgi:hypothetical protein